MKLMAFVKILTESLLSTPTENDECYVWNIKNLKICLENFWQMLKLEQV